MPRLILKSPYIKPGGGKNAGGYVQYIATREGVQKISDSRRNLPATKKQKALIEQLTIDFPDMKELFEYEDYIASPTRENASELITMALEVNLEVIQHSEIYVGYIATRPGTQKQGEHGLFSDEKNPALAAIRQEVSEHKGNVWTHIFSLCREDAERLGFDKAEAWRDLLMTHRDTISQAMKIPQGEFRWCAAYHDAGHHPHVHMVAYSADPKGGYLTKNGIQEIKSAVARDIFRQDLTSIYEQKTGYRREVMEQIKETMDTLIQKMQNGVHENPVVERLLLELAEQLKDADGKKVYGYLKAPLKKMVDQIVDALAGSPLVTNCYQKWWELQCEILRTYKDELPELLPLSRQKEFQPIKNMIIKEALGLGGSAFVTDIESQSDDDAPQEWSDALEAEDDPKEQKGNVLQSDCTSKLHIEWSEDYLLARQHLFGGDEVEQDFFKARELFIKEAEEGNVLAMYDLGRMAQDGLGSEPDKELAERWYEKALNGFLILEEEKKSAYLEYRIGKMNAAGLGTGQDYGKAALWFQKACMRDHKYALYSLAGLNQRGQGVPQNLGESFRLYERSALKDFPYAHYELARMLQKGEGTQKDSVCAEAHMEKAFQGFRSLEEKGRDDKLQYRIGWMLLTDTGTEKDETLAREYFEKAAQLGNPHAQFQLAKLYLSDKESDPFQIQDAIRWLEQAAGDGNPAAQYQLAKVYRDGMHVEIDIQKAIELLQMAAEKEHDYASYALGKLYLDGAETHKDIEKALCWLIHSADRNNPHAQYNLGKIYLEGEDIPKNVDAAVRWLSASAVQGNQFAQYTLGKVYLLGKEVTKDKEKAISFFTAAAAQGNEYAQYFLDHMDDLQKPSLALATTRLMHHLGNIFRDKSVPSPASGGQHTDRKLRQKLLEKKIAQGHARGDHEITR